MSRDSVRPRLVPRSAPLPGDTRRLDRGRVGSGILGDFRLAARMLRQETSFAALVVFTLALGIGSSAAVFGMADALLLRPLSGVHDGGRVAYLRLEAPGGVDKGLTTPEFDDVVHSATLLDGIASYDVQTFDASVGDVHGVHADAALDLRRRFRTAGRAADRRSDAARLG